MLCPSNQCTRLGTQGLHDHPHRPQWMPHVILKLSLAVLPAASPSEIGDFPTFSRDWSLHLSDIQLHSRIKNLLKKRDGGQIVGNTTTGYAGRHAWSHLLV